jgi:hypothetical protein
MKGIRRALRLGGEVRVSTRSWRTTSSEPWMS